MRETGRAVEVNATLLKRKVALAVDAEVVLSTPVDTGRARSNWQVEINAPAAGTRDAYVPGTEASTAGPNAQAAIDHATAVISRAQSEEAIHITNNLAYIGRLNEGWSAQAPAGFVEAAIMAGAMRVKEAKLIIKVGDRVVRYDLGRIG